MSNEKMPTNPEQSQNNLESIEAASEILASEFHEDWRSTRLQDDDTFEPRVKSTKDEAWIQTHGTDEVDIANTDYSDLPADWKAENKAAAEVVVKVMVDYNGNIDLGDAVTRDKVGDTVHSAWLSRNEWAKGSELDVPFAELPEDEQAKDIAQIEIAQKTFS